MTPTSDAIVIGAGPAGLSCAVTLRAAGMSATLLEKADSVGAVWRRHYDRLHLHTDRNHSGLPHMPMPRDYPVYPSRAQVVDYLESYAARFDIAPVFGTEVTAIRRDDAQWLVETSRGAFSAPVVVVATGIADAPYRPSWPGIETFRGPIVHSSDYRNPQAFAGKRVLVVGFGNSGGEIALDLAEAKVDVAIAVRSPVQIIPRDLLGLPILTWVIFYRISAGAACRCYQRAGAAPRAREFRKAWLASRRQGPAADGGGRRPRPTDRHRHAQDDQGWQPHRCAAASTG